MRIKPGILALLLPPVFLLSSFALPARMAAAAEASGEKVGSPESVQQNQVISPADSPSGFELFVGGVTPLTEAQFDILKRLEGIAYSETPGPIPDAAIRVPVRIVRDTGAAGGKATIRAIVTAGYLTGGREAIARAFSLLGIRSLYTDSRELRQFGYDFFDRAPGLFNPAQTVPLGPDYVVGPGDEIRIAVWGRVEAQYRVSVDREGNIQLPVAGVIGVAGLSYGELKDAIRRELSRYYTGFEVNVTLGALRAVSIYMVGAARNPGVFTVSPVSTLVNTLVATGGPGKSGSLRRIELRREGKRIAEFDFYEFLLRGNSGGDVRVQQNDVVFVPQVGRLVALSGTVRAPAVYELKDETGLRDLVQLAGGLGPEAFLGRVRIERIVDGKRVEILEDDLSAAMGRNDPLQDGDFVSVFPVESDRRTVAVHGAVQREGEYGLARGMRIRDLLALSGGLKAFADTDAAELGRVRKQGAGTAVEVIRVDLGKALAGDPAHDLPLQDRDRLFVRTAKGAGRQRYATVSGEVRFPGPYSIRDGDTISALVARAGGYTEAAYPRGAVFKRESVRQIQQSRLEESIARLERDLLSRAAGSVSSATSEEEVKAREAELRQARELVEKLRGARATGRMVLEFPPSGKPGKPAQDLALEDGDSLYVPPDPRSLQTLGAVLNQTAFAFDVGKGLRDYIEMAGGYTEFADRDRVFVLKVDGSAVRPERSRFWLFSASADRARDGGPLLESGDTIVVPEKVERVAWLRETKDITQILFQVAVAAGVVIALF